MWADYLKERQGKKVLQWKNGFTVYSYPGNDICYIEDNYVEPHMRKKGLAKGMADEIVVEARKNGCTTLVGSVDIKAYDPGMNMKVLLSYGMAPYHIDGSVIYFRKNI